MMTNLFVPWLVVCVVGVTGLGIDNSSVIDSEDYTYFQQSYTLSVKRFTQHTTQIGVNKITIPTSRESKSYEMPTNEQTPATLQMERNDFSTESMSSSKRKGKLKRNKNKQTKPADDYTTISFVARMGTDELNPNLHEVTEDNNNKQSTDSEICQILTRRRKRRCNNISVDTNVSASGSNLKSRRSGRPAYVIEFDNVLFYIRPVVYTVGFILNIMGLRIFINEGEKSSTSMTCLLLTTSINFILSIIFYCTSSFPYSDLNTVSIDIIRWVNSINFYLLIKATEALIQMQYAILAINTFIAIAKPFYLKRFFTVNHHKKVIFALTVVCLTMYPLNLYIYQFKPFKMKENNEFITFFISSKTAFGNKNPNIKIIYDYVAELVPTLLSMPVTSIFCVLALVSYKKSIEISKKLTSDNRYHLMKLQQRRQFTRVFIAIIIIQLVVKTPHMILLILSFSNKAATGHLIVFMKYLADILEKLHHLSTTLIFLAMSSSFRKSFVKRYGCLKH